MSRVRQFISLLITSIIICISAINFTAYASASSETQSAATQNNSTEIKDYFYYTDDQGNVIISVGPAKLNLGQSEINKGPDGCYYTPDNVQLNTLKVIADKYYSRYSELAETDIMNFDSYDELIAFILYLQHYKSDTQGTTVYLTSRTQVQKSELQKLEAEKTGSYKNKIAQLASTIPSNITTVEELKAVDQLVKDTLRFDWTRRSATYTMDQALSAGYGVCFHQAKLMNDILEQLNIKTELLSGYWVDTQNGKETKISHTWLRAYDGAKWIYIDPSLAGSGLLDSEFYINHYQMYPIQDST